MTSSFLKSGTAAPGIIAPMGKGRVNVHYNKKRNCHRFRFQPIYPDQAETILHCLAIAREDGETEYDTVALDYICMHFLSTYTPEHVHA